MSKTAAASLAGLGAAGAGGWGIYTLTKENPSIPFSQRVNTEKRVILDTSTTSHDSVWAEVVKEYEKKGDIKEVPKGSNAQEKLKLYCQNSKSSTSSSFEEFRKYQDYCTRENLITKLSTSAKSWNTSKDENQWSAAETSYKGSENTEGTLLIPKDSGTIAKASVTKQDIMSHCETISSKPFVNEADGDYKRGEKWCTVANNG
ncbi:hypothetical protein HF1_08460 [Mycoplasma haemofelis str. Langford 1]|nr:hypothetical protein [Mycoplasma haemofelis]CBY92854.1 hypothetical protein HF1_08460 [Mycoplasma haemofelis str. Langford 1]